MRTITFKLVLGFLVVGLISIALMLVLARWNTNQEFMRFVTDRAQNDTVSALTKYYQSNGSWENVESLFPSPSSNPPDANTNHNDHPIPPFTLTDANGVVVLARDRFPIGELVPANELSGGIAIKVAGKTVGILMMSSRQPFANDPRALEFVQRNTVLLIYSSLGATLVALLLGILISRTLTRPIRELTAATHAISEGNFDQQVPVRSKDEMGELARAFNRMSTELARSIHTRRQMTADIAHELRTPLSLILGHAEAVHDGVLPPTRENFEIVREEAERLEHLVDDLRTLSLADAGELKLNPQTFSVSKLMQDLSAHYQFQTQQKNIDLQLDLDPTLPDLTADPARITQVLTNILDNALRHTPAGGRVILSARLTSEGIELSVRDTGPGLASEDLDRIFDRFYRADAARHRADGGSGLGLAIARSIVQAHGGGIRAESQLGDGLKVIITLPETAISA
jgi:signal transduction histidine kinase